MSYMLQSIGIEVQDIFFDEDEITSVGGKKLMEDFRYRFTERALNDGIEEAIVYGALITGSILQS